MKKYFGKIKHNIVNIKIEGNTYVSLPSKSVFIINYQSISSGPL